MNNKYSLKICISGIQHKDRVNWLALASVLAISGAGARTKAHYLEVVEVLEVWKTERTSGHRAELGKFPAGLRGSRRQKAASGQPGEGDGAGRQTLNPGKEVCSTLDVEYRLRLPDS